MGGGGGGFGGGGGKGSDINWVGHGYNAIGAWVRRERTKEATYRALEAAMSERNLPIPPRPMSQVTIFWIGFACGLLLGLLIGLIFWELT